MSTMRSDLSSKSLLFHHHEQVFIDHEGKLWMQSGISLWIRELIQYFGTVHLMLFTTQSKSKKHDMYIEGPNVQLVDLGSKGNYFDFIQKRMRVLRIAKTFNNNVDYFLIRGFTPMQNLVWHAVKAKERKIYYLVRSLKQDLPWTLFSLSFVAHLANRKKEREFRKILASDCLMMANSELIASELRSNTNNPVRFAPTNVISRSVVPPFGLAERGEVFKVLFVGRISPMKGMTEFIQAFVQVLKSHPSIELNIVGEGESEYVAGLKKVLLNNDVDDKVVFHGRLSFGPDLFELYRSCNAFVLPSHSEGFARVLWESALFSCPIIATKVGGIPLVLKDGENALLIDVKSPEAIKSGILELIRNETLASEMAIKAYHLALENTLESGVKRFVESISNEKVNNLGYEN